MNDEFVYDRVPYPSLVFSQTSPDRLATMATYFGMTPAHPQNCRFMELGCGDGTNLLALAYLFPGSKFVGLDLSEAHISDAKKGTADLGISNVEFLHEDVMNLSREQVGDFDFIVAHGLYSWVPDFVREKVLSIYSECLSPSGGGYISYNALPGYYIRQMLRDMIEYHTAGLSDPIERVNGSLSLINFLRESTPKDRVFGSIMDFEFEKFVERSVSNIFHDDLAETNQPFYFHEFAEQLSKNGLQYLSESTPVAMTAADLPRATQEVLRKLEDDTIRYEQYIDFIKCRRFRSTLACRNNIQLFRRPSARTIKKFYIQSHLAPTSADPEIVQKVSVEFAAEDTTKINTDHPLTKATLVCLSKNASTPLTFEEILKQVARIFVDSPSLFEEEQRQIAARNLMAMFEVGQIEFSLFRPSLVEQIGDRPRSSELARYQIARGCESVTGSTGKSHPLDNAFTTALIAMLDGSRDREALITAMLEMVDVPEEERESFLEQLPELIDLNLSKMATLGILVE
jgi:methyltransferase-like protein